MFVITDKVGFGLTNQSIVMHQKISAALSGNLQPSVVVNFAFDVAYIIKDKKNCNIHKVIKQGR